MLYDAEYIIVRDLEITNCAEHIIGEKYSQGDKMERIGVAVVAKDKGMRRGITLKNLKIHDVNGNVYDKHMNNGGIYGTKIQIAITKNGGKVRQINTYFVKDNILYHIYADVWAQESGRADIPINDFLVILDEIEECAPIN